MNESWNKESLIDYDKPNKNHSIIKILGVGGGGGNIVNYIYNQGVDNVTFAVCNTDQQDLDKSPIPTKISIGNLGAGDDPESGKKAAEDNADKIRELLSDGTQMLFIVAGLGKGTGTGASPVIARIAKEMGILTVATVTIPFVREQMSKVVRALKTVDTLKDIVDSLIIINNENIKRVFPNLGLISGMKKADEVVSNAVISIAEIITKTGKRNADFNDVRTTLKNGGVAIIGTGYGEGEHRIKKAIEEAKNSPIIAHNDISNAKRIMFILYSSEAGEPTFEESQEIQDFSLFFDQRKANFIEGAFFDETLEDKVKITILATGFDTSELLAREFGGAYHNELEEEKMEEHYEKIEKVYGKDAVKAFNKKITYKKKNIYIFNDETIDNELVIETIDNNPTYNRSKAVLESINDTLQQESRLASSSEESGVITF